MYKHILVATDGSALADKAVSAALQLSTACGASRVTALMVVPDYGTHDVMGVVFSNGPGLDELRERLAQAGRERLQEALHRQAPARVRVEPRVVVSDYPYEEIVRHAESEGCVLIVMASRGRGAAASALLGSQTSHVLSLAKVPVLVVK
jgi:nucleotide-binding universal stress UspA family protein